jgi:hypothetical protein
MAYFCATLDEARSLVASEHERFAAHSCSVGVRDLYNRLAGEVRMGIHDRGILAYRVSTKQSQGGL